MNIISILNKLDSTEIFYFSSYWLFMIVLSPWLLMNLHNDAWLEPGQVVNPDKLRRHSMIQKTAILLQ